MTGTLLQKHRPRVEETRRDDVTGTLLSASTHQWSMEKQRLKFKHWDRQHVRNGTRFRTRRGRPPTDRQERVCARKVNVLIVSERVGVLVLWSSTFGKFRQHRRCYKVSGDAITFTIFLSHILQANQLQAVTKLSPE